MAAAASGGAGACASGPIVIDSANRIHVFTALFAGYPRTYLVKNSQYWRFPTGKFDFVDKGYPAALSAWGSFDANPDCFLKWGKRVYVFKGDKYWRLNEGSSAVDPGYPLSVTKEWGLPGPVTAAFVVGEETYFINRKRYYKMDAAGAKVVKEGAVRDLFRGFDGEVTGAYCPDWGSHVYLMTGPQAEVCVPFKLGRSHTLMYSAHMEAPLPTLRQFNIGSTVHEPGVLETAGMLLAGVALMKLGIVKPP